MYTTNALGYQIITITLHIYIHSMYVVAMKKKMCEVVPHIILIPYARPPTAAQRHLL